jgi:hypothetical protein
VVIFKETGEHGCKGCIFNDGNIGAEVCYSTIFKKGFDCGVEKGIFILETKKGEKEWKS